MATSAKSRRWTRRPASSPHGSRDATWSTASASWTRWCLPTPRRCTMSQGSEYPAVVVPMLTQQYAMLKRNLLYTGVTRGKRLVVLVGQKKAVAIAVRNASGRRLPSHPDCRASLILIVAPQTLVEAERVAGRTGLERVLVGDVECGRPISGHLIQTRPEGLAGIARRRQPPTVRFRYWFGERDGHPRGPPSEVVFNRDGIGLRAANHCKNCSAGKMETCHRRIAAGCDFSTPA